MNRCLLILVYLFITMINMIKLTTLSWIIQNQNRNNFTPFKIFKKNLNKKIKEMQFPKIKHMKINKVYIFFQIF